MKVLTLKQEPRKKPVKVLDYKTGTENRTDCLKLVSPSYSHRSLPPQPCWLGQSGSESRRLFSGEMVCLSTSSCRHWFTYACLLDPCEAAKFNSIEYFSTQDFGIDIQSSIFRDKNLTFLNDRVFFNTKFFNIKTIEYFSTQILNIQTIEYFSTLIFKYTTGQCQKIMNVLNCYSEQE